MKLAKPFSFGLVWLLTLAATGAMAQPTSSPATAPVPVLEINAGKVTGRVSPTLYGLMTEEINFSYEGGLYGELIRNRTFKANATNAVYWQTVGDATISLDTNQPLNAALNVSLKLEAGTATPVSPVGIANGGYWGIPVRPHTTYHASLYARGNSFSGPLTLSLESADGKTVFATAIIPKISGDWQKYDATLTTGDVPVSKDNRLTVTTAKLGSFASYHGTVWFQQVSLFPPTWHDRPNGNRPDLMQLLADMQPKFLRFPGGNYLEGDYFNERFNWKATVGDISERPGHRSPWNYWSTDGLGLLEFLDWCEDLKMQPVLAVFAGYALRHDYAKPGPDLEPYVQDALDEIEYVTGATSTRWGAQRARDGHPAPFELHYVEIGNEDWFDRSQSYDGRFTRFYDAIKAKYPDLKLISTIGNEHSESQRVHGRVPDLVDEHYYRSEEEMEAHALDYDKYSRLDKTKIFVGEWATRVGSPTPNMAGALGDAAWMTGMERNSDIVLISSYAPLLVNVSNPTESRRDPNSSMQWRTDLIGYDALNSYGSPAYYAQKMFSTHHGDQILATDSQNLPTRMWQPPVRTRNGVPQGPPPDPRPIRQIFFDATRNSADGTITLKMVNVQGKPQSVNVVIDGVKSVEPTGSAVVLKADDKNDTNTMQDPAKVMPRTETADGLAANFTRELPACSITILELKTK